MATLLRSNASSKFSCTMSLSWKSCGAVGRSDYSLHGGYGSADEAKTLRKRLSSVLRASLIVNIGISS